MDTFAEAIDQFLTHCSHERKFSRHTIKAYRLDLRAFAAHLGKASPGLGLTDLASDHLRAYARSRGQKKARTIKRNIACVKSFLRYHHIEGRIAIDLAGGWRTGVKLGLALPRTISRSAVEGIFAAVYRPPSSRRKHERIKLARNRALIEVLFCTGLRVAEVSALLVGSFDLGDDVIRVNGKGSRERIVPIVSPPLRRALCRWLEVRRWHHPQIPFLFTNRLGLQLSDQSIRTIIRKIAEVNGVGRVTPHMFRHTLATQLLEQGVDLRHIQRLLGHSSITTTTIYAQVTDRSQRQSLLVHHPRRLLRTPCAVG